MNRSQIGILATVVLALLVFMPTTKTYFSQDDWVFLSHTYKRPFSEIFRYHPEAFYRPIGQQLFFWIGGVVFGLNPIGYHLMALGVFALNIALLYTIMKEINKRSAFDWIALWLFAFNPIHFVALNWLTQVDLEIATLFALLTIFLFTTSTKERNIVAMIGAFLSFILGLLSHEITSAVPLVLFFWQRKSLKVYLMGLTAALVLIGKYSLNPFPLVGDYSLAPSLRTVLSTVKWYMFRAVGIPEGIKQAPMGLKLAAFVPLFVIIARRAHRLIPGLFIFTLSLVPVLLLSRHFLSSYAVVALALMAIEVSRDRLVKESSATRFVLLFGGFVIPSLIVVSFLWEHHWSTSRGQLARAMTSQFYRASDQQEREIRQMSTDYQNHPETYFATMFGKQFEVISR